MAVSHGSLPFQEQIDYFRGKTDIPSRTWTDIYQVEHDWAFVVAGTTKRSLLSDMRGAVEKAITTGLTLEQFRKDFDQIVSKHGWQYNGGLGWRSRVIYETNLRQSYNAGREAQMADPELRKRRPFAVYRHGDSAHPRPQHLAWDGTVLPLDDPWWATHSPQNGWGCKCKKYMLSQRDVDRQGLKVGPAPVVEYENRTIGINSPNGPRVVRVPKGIDPGFDFAPGQSRLNAGVPPLQAFDPLPDPGSRASSVQGAGLPNRRAPGALPPAREMAADRLLPSGLSDVEYVDRFLAEFGAAERAPVVFKDVTGDAVVVGRDLFTSAKTGALKIRKRGHARELLLLADAIKDPDEVWVRLEWLYSQNRAVVRRRYISRYQVDGEPVPALSVFEVGDDGWDGVTTFSPDANDPDYLEQLRIGVRLYRRPQIEKK
ncbi:Phage Mu protein F like protein [Pseudomonas sp. NFPP10]|uniref:PBECR2 nuclease fold domain-containing protein n=1 Tax=unclassified Pseudomonas TaxID=196821 RepID=UPI00088DF060|nr:MULTISPECIES: PBECR2 nuclease fold domain-containing protein [unclassified Pseudomonas]SDA18147.1 Phage Mu protein F like protein [Pseudomonas sp. NFPP12]SEK99151.1 Phage Mu protein F like protein [Pseudomonas sp. NFPP10]SFI57804.1 Phage Mu protein F like protein [Pseudomonas sp. NFPP08]SFM42948.1 Phage Mu protein F like protein [Pseudomonas sp. NFPP05]SFX31393.1 Phage Mu protein F like protein [Pseudomonas sp. NFPP09]